MLGKVHTWKSSRPSPPIVCLHGYLGSGSDFQILADSYRDHPTLIAPNFPDYGCSPSSEKTTWPKTIDALYTFLQDTLKSTPCILLGYSMGGRIALQFATKYPQLLKALVLVGATPGIKDEVKREERKRSDEALASTIMTRSVEAFIESWNQQPLIKTQERIPSPYQEVMMDVRNTHNKEALSHFLRFLGTGTMESAWL